jgi:hypothetical protein
VVEIFESQPWGSTEARRIKEITKKARRREEKRREEITKVFTMRGHATLTTVCLARQRRHHHLFDREIRE